MKNTKAKKEKDITDEDFAKFMVDYMEFGFLLEIAKSED